MLTLLRLVSCCSALVLLTQCQVLGRTLQAPMRLLNSIAGGLVDAEPSSQSVPQRGQQIQQLPAYEGPARTAISESTVAER
jgi:hypothetical protein